jgi:hypothetical protein
LLAGRGKETKLQSGVLLELQIKRQRKKGSEKPE